ncbi:MAG: hypothetical protein AAGI49_17855, partial [Bacteroidota bacterium]
GSNCKSVVYGFDEANNSDFIGINEQLFSKSSSENIGLQEDSTPNMLLGTPCVNIRKLSNKYA